MTRNAPSAAQERTSQPRNTPTAPRGGPHPRKARRMPDHITDREAIRSAWEDDLERTRIVHRVGAALNSGKDAAVIDVVIDEVRRATHPTGRDEEIARRLGWATGRNGWTLLRAIRSEGLGIVIVAPEDRS